MSMKRPTKSYVDRAVQTDSSGLTRSNCNTLFSQHLECVDASEAALCDAAFGLDARQSSPESAYIQPSRQDKYPAITFSRPSGQIPASYEQRIVSLPDSASRCSANAVIETRTRVVSMPEHRTKFDCNASMTQRRSPVLPDTGCYSSNISIPVQVHQRKRERPYPSDLPRTPTPPSSPDSILIIGNEESKVSDSFLRPQQIDEHGWITWASSPPRPIPALHGPLSLPYARCPSGAEGTVIEGDDLSHKIWGLGVDGVQGHPRAVRPTTNHISQSGASRNILSIVDSQRDHQTQRHSASLHHRDEVIDLSKPSSFLGPTDLQNILNRQALLGNRSQPSLLTESSGQHDLDHRIIGLLDGFDNNISSSINLDNRPRHPSGILGHEWRNLLVSGTPAQPELPGFKGRRGSINLNKSAPVFVPASDSQTPSLGAYMRGSDEYVYASDAYSQRRNPTNYISVTQRQQNNDLITPPSTSSSRWSPVFTSQYPSINLKEPTSTKELQPLMYRIPMVHSPDPQDDYSGNRFTIQSNIQEVDQGREPAQNFGSHGLTFSSIDPVFSPNLDLKEFTGSILRPEAHTKSFAPSNQFQSAYEVVDPAPERRRNLSYQHPRSIPLARLIQRRLSSVAEEDANFSHESLLPFLRKNLPNSSLKHLETESLHASFPGLSGLGMSSREEGAGFRFSQGRTAVVDGSSEYPATFPLHASINQKMNAKSEIDDVHGKENKTSVINPTDKKADPVASRKAKSRKRKSGGSTSAPTQLASS